MPWGLLVLRVCICIDPLSCTFLLSMRSRPRPSSVKESLVLRRRFALAFPIVQFVLVLGIVGIWTIFAFKEILLPLCNGKRMATPSSLQGFPFFFSAGAAFLLPLSKFLTDFSFTS